MTPTATTDVQDLGLLLERQDRLEFAVLIGSRSTGQATEQSDWDIAIQWGAELSFTEQLSRTEQLRHALMRSLGIKEQKIDLIDVRSARLAMRALVAEEGRVLAVNDELAWIRFLKATWSELEDHYWRAQHAA
jgi:predicted nucleotidyltransferase